MGELFDWWMGGGDFYDRKQQRALDDLTAAQFRTESALRRSMQAQATDLGTRLSRLEDALVALVELEDTREELTSHADAAATRRYARQVVTQLPSMGGAGDAAAAPPVPPDVDDYWLHPAVRALSARLRPGEGDVVELTAEAHRRDPLRTDQFVVCVATLAGQPEEAADTFDRCLPGGREVTTFQRTLWIEAAAGRLGTAAAERLVERLRQLADDGDAELIGAMRAAVLGRDRAPATPLEAGQQLATLHDAVTEPAGTAAAPPPADSTVPPGPPSSATEPSVASGNALAERLAELVNEGAPGESATLDRMTSIRSALGAIGVDTAPARPSVDAPVGELRALLVADLGDAHGGPGLRSTAARALAEPLAAWATELRDTALVAPATTAVVRIAGGDEVVTADGPAPTGWQPRLAQPPSPLVRRAPLILGALAVLAMVTALLALMASPGWWVVVIAALAGIGWAASRYLSERRAEVARQDDATVEAQRQLDEAARSLRSTLDATGATAAAADGQHRAIVEALDQRGRSVTSSPAAGGPTAPIASR